MILIAHRGNTNGPKPKLENKLSYINDALNKGYQAEVDVWFDKTWWTGHDKPQYKVTCDWLYDRRQHLWIHCKNLDSLTLLVKTDKCHGISGMNYFWHEHDCFTLTSQRFIWTYINHRLTSLSVCVLPEQGNYSKKDLKACFAICSDRVSSYKKL